MIARALGGLGICAATRGDLEQAMTRLEASARLSRAVDDRRGLAASLNNLARAQHLSGRLEASMASLRECIALRREVGDRFGLALALANLGSAQVAGDPAAAEATLRSALEVFRQIGNPSGTILTLNRLGDLLATRSALTEAHACHAEALTLALSNGEMPQALEALAGLAVLAGMRGRACDAVTVLQWILDRPEQDHARTEAISAHLDRVVALEPADAVAAARERASTLSRDAIVSLARAAAAPEP